MLGKSRRGFAYQQRQPQSLSFQLAYHRALDGRSDCQSLESSVRRRNSGSARLQSGRQAKEQSVNRAQVRKEKAFHHSGQTEGVGGFSVQGCEGWVDVSVREGVRDGLGSIK